MSEPDPTGRSADEAEGPTRQDLLEVVDRRIRELSDHADPEVREAAEELLQAFDLVHRVGLVNLVHGIQSLAGEAFLNRLCGDAAVRLLLMSYGLIQVDRSLLAEEALDTVRGHLVAHGVTVELLEVVGGVVYVRVNGADRPGVTLEGVRADLEAALKAEFLGFQQLEIGERSPTESLVQLGGRRPLRRPRYVDAVELAELGEGRLTPVVLGTEAVLIVRLDDDSDAEGGVRALHNRCGDSPLPLEHATLSGYVLECPWHGCRYDLRSGRRLDQPGEAPLFLLPVRVEEGRVRIAVGTEPVPTGGEPGEGRRE